MQNRSNAVTKEEARFGSENSAGQNSAANDEMFEEEAANDAAYSENAGMEGPSNVRPRYGTSSDRYKGKQNERGVASDVYRKVRERRAAAEAGAQNASAYAQNESVKAAGAQFSTQAARQAKTKAAAALKLRKGVGVVGWGMLAPVGTAYFFQLVFGLVSLVGFGLFAAIEEFKTTVVGSVLSWFVDLTTFIPADILGFAFWGLATLLAIGVFIVCLLVFYLTGVDAFSTTLSFLIATLALALSMLPVTNLIPWLLLWVIYVRVISTAALFSGG